MGIKDLLKFMKPYTERIHIKKYAGKRVGIDAYSWLHKGAYSCSMEICLDSNGDKKLKYLDYFMHRINLLKHYKMIPVVVFDGGNIPIKSATEHERHKRREANRELAMEKLKNGDVNAASELFQRGVSITPFMAHQLIQILKSENIEFVVAPYEADAQLAYFSSLEEEKGGVVAVITEDSDLLAYACQATIFKMDRYGNGEEILLDRVFKAVACKPSFQQFNMELFTGMCVLAGCDFLPSVPGIGIVKAHSFVAKYRNLERVLSVLKLEKGGQMPEDYAKSFLEAFSVFQHARIYDTETKATKHMKPVPQTLMESLDGKLDFLGPEIPSAVATAIAVGTLNPITMEAFDCFTSSRCQPDPIVIQSSYDLQKFEANTVFREKSCFLGFSSQKTREKDVSGALMKQDLPTESKYIDEALALHKLISPPEVGASAEQIRVTNNVQLKIPKNPFMISKTEEIHQDQRMCSSEQVSDAAENEKPNILCFTPDKNPLRFSDNIPSKKRKSEVRLDHRESFTEQVSEVTELENSDMLATKESQDSVNSKPKKISDRKDRGKVKKLKRSNHMTSGKTNTILNFFSRV